MTTKQVALNNRQITTSRNHQIDHVYPLRFVRGQPQPFPTIYWLQDPALLRQLSDLERLNHVGRFEAMIAADEVLRENFRGDHEAYRDERWAMLSNEHRAIVEASPSMSRSFRGGVAGIADYDTVKCLHAHYAYHLARHESGGTALGRLIERTL